MDESAERLDRARLCIELRGVSVSIEELEGCISVNTERKGALVRIEPCRRRKIRDGLTASRNDEKVLMSCVFDTDMTVCKGERQLQCE